MPFNKLPRRVSEREPEGTNEEIPEVRWGEYDAVGLIMA
jgi:hypothetical protein